MKQKTTLILQIILAMFNFNSLPFTSLTRQITRVTIQNVTEPRIGIYQCSIENPAGYNMSTTSLQYLGKILCNLMNNWSIKSEKINSNTYFYIDSIRINNFMTGSYVLNY